LKYGSESKLSPNQIEEYLFLYPINKEVIHDKRCRSV
jgi:hypothetical protein